MQEASSIKVWDVAVRVFHWSLVVLFFVAYFSGDDDSTLHVYAGYAVLALVAFRIVWGFIGSRHARFSDFVRGPAATLCYAKSLASGRPRHYLGHNPLGGWMVVALLVSLLATCWSGLEAYGEKGQGPLASLETSVIALAAANGDDRERRDGRKEGRDGKERDGFWEEVHEVLSNFTLFLVFLHVLGGFLSSWLHGENLIRAMITGYKPRRAP
ncbi:MAG TPA: cytochrome b/b6 domain-containing protein [Burkholderiales bacterium]|nr:cytochrome b/b6 domain-containing protein [Burkholderiales bacterium]